MTDALFPLPLTPFERYMLADDRRDYPMTYVAQFHFRGTVDREDWEAAYHEALDRHPLLTSVVQGRRFWVPASGRSEIVWLGLEEKIVPGGGEYIDLSQQAGIRAWMNVSADQVRLTVQFHHACCDGIGCFQFVGDWLAAYHARSNGANSGLAPLDSLALAERGKSRWKIDQSAPVSRWRTLRTTCSELLKFAVRRPSPLRGNRTHQENSFPGYRHHTFSKGESRRLRTTASQANANLNDLLLRDLFVTLADWNNAAQSKEWLQIAMPSNLRGRGDADLPAANVIGYAFMVCRARDCADESKLLKVIGDSTADIRERNAGQLFLDGITRLQNIPGALSLFTSPRSCATTTVFSNVGDHTHRFYSRLPRVSGRSITGKLTLERFLGTPPLRPLTKAVFLATIYAGELTIIMRGDDRMLGRDNSQKLLDRFVGQLLRSSTAEEQIAAED
jgi:hypothetical protein